MYHFSWRGDYFLYNKIWFTLVRVLLWQNSTLYSEKISLLLHLAAIIFCFYIDMIIKILNKSNEIISLSLLMISNQVPCCFSSFDKSENTCQSVAKKEFPSTSFLKDNMSRAFLKVILYLYWLNMQKHISSCYPLPYLFNTYILYWFRSALNPYTYLEARDFRPMNVITDKHNILDEQLFQNQLLNLILFYTLYKIVAKVISCKRFFWGEKT